MKHETSPTVHQKIFFALGTGNTITYYEDSAEEAVREAIGRVGELHRLLSAFDTNSDIGRINQNAGIRPVPVAPETLYLISSSIMYTELTEGAFDITAGRLSALWKAAMADRQEPSPQAVRTAVGLTNVHDILIDKTKSTVMLRQPGQSLDLGAIAKGFAADEVKKILTRHDVQNAVINLGGTVITLGESVVGLQNPFQKTGISFASLSLTNKAVVSSGTYEQEAWIGQRRVHHIINPTTGYPADTDLRAVTLIGEYAEELDALATAALVSGIQNINPLLEAGGIEAVFVTHDRRIYTTESIIHQLIWTQPQERTGA